MRFPHIGQTDCVAGHVGLELRCAGRKIISLICRVSSDSGTPAETAAVPVENDLLCWRSGPLPTAVAFSPHCEPRTQRSACVISQFESSHPGKLDSNFDAAEENSAAPRCNA